MIEWKDIVGFSEIDIHGTKIVIIGVSNPEYWIEKEENKIRKKMMIFSAKQNKYGSPFNITASTMQIKHDELMQMLNESLKKYKV